MKRTKKKDYLLYKYAESENGHLVKLPSSPKESPSKAFVRLYINGVWKLEKRNSDLLQELKFQISASNLSWEKIGKHLSMSRATIYRKIRNGKLNPFEVQSIYDFLKSKNSNVRPSDDMAKKIEDTVKTFKTTIYGKGNVKPRYKLKGRRSKGKNLKSPNA